MRTIHPEQLMASQVRIHHGANAYDYEYALSLRVDARDCRTSLVQQVVATIGMCDIYSLDSLSIY